MSAVIRLDLQALAHNVEQARDYAPESKLIAVIKANAYGHGAVLVAETLKNSVDMLAVACMTEAIQLRKAQVSTAILVLQGVNTATELSLAYEYDLNIVVHAEHQIGLLENDKRKGLNLWLKCDTGMNRLGFSADMFKPALQRLLIMKHDISVMTHFSNADDLDDNKTTQQIQLFHQLTKGFTGEKSCANSAGIIAWPTSHYQWVRSGTMLYGASPMLSQSAQQLNLKPVMNFQATVIAIKSLKKGDTVGYGSTWVASKATRIAVVSAGYGDGYPRHTRENTPVLIKGQRYPLVGRVSMDMLTVDIADNDIVIGDKVLLWGAGLPVEEIAGYANTIGYTLLCGITRRVAVQILDEQ